MLDELVELLGVLCVLVGLFEVIEGDDQMALVVLLGTKFADQRMVFADFLEADTEDEMSSVCC